jgi:hypothetical protein
MIGRDAMTYSDDLVQRLRAVRDEARRSSMDEVAFMIELAITAALDNASPGVADTLVANRTLN